MEAPPPVAQKLSAQASAIAKHNLALAAESLRLQRVFDDARIPVIFFKGAALAMLAYGSLSLKHGKDIDVLVPPECAERALQLLEREGYGLWLPAKNLNAAQRRAVIHYSKEAELVHRDCNVQVELHWKLVDNPSLLAGLTAHADTQDVPLAGGAGLRTFRENELFAYLCVHGATHAWSRLKWLADLNALVAGKSDAQMESLYRRAGAMGAGWCAGQALLLCEQLLGLRLPPGLRSEFTRSRRIQRLVSIARGVMIGADAETETLDRRFGTTRINLAQFLLQPGWGYFVRQCEISCMTIVDVLDYPLPAGLHFLYPLMRVPRWLLRRAPYRGRSAPTIAP